MIQVDYNMIVIATAVLALIVLLIAYRQQRLSHQDEAQQWQMEMDEAQLQLQQMQVALNDAESESESIQNQLVQAQQELAVANADKRHGLTQIEHFQKQIQQVQIDLKNELLAKNQLEKQLASLQVTLEKETQHWQEKSKDYEEQKVALKKEFEHLAQKIFEAKQNQFTQVSQQSMESILTPFREQVSEFRKRVDDVFHKETEQRSSLVKELKQLKELNQQMSADAQQLTDALKGDKKIQGNWGEVVLERLLEVSGLQKGREYETQANFTLPNGKRLMPDVLIKLPENKTLIIDAKVSLVDYESYVAADSEQVKQKALKQHVIAIQNQVDRLSDKDYQSIPELATLDFVIMFVPIEPAYVIALQEAPQLFEKAFEKRVILVSPSTLLSTLRVVNNLWRYEHQNKNAQEIAKQAGDMLDKFIGFSQSLNDIGNRIEQAQEAYVTAKNRLESGRGNLISRAQRLKKLGAKVTKSLPESTEEFD